MSPTSPKIVVGVDGSPSSIAAVDWAASEARRTGACLQLVLAYQASWVGITPDGFIVPTAKGSDMPHALEEAKARAVSVWPDAQVAMVALAQSPAHALVSLSRDADLVVVGAHGRSAVARLLLGSVSQHVATHAHCPAVVVRGTPSHSDEPVTVGIDDSATAAAAVQWAARAACARHATLWIVHAWARPPVTGYGAWVPPADLAPAIHNAAERFVDSVVADIRAEHPDLAVRSEVLEGNPSSLLLDRAENSQLLVVGAHGRGAFPGTWFGSAATAAIHHSDCPVVVFPSVHQPEVA